MVLSDETCPLFLNLMEDESVVPLWRACCSTKNIEQQTAVRLILVASTQSTYIYNQSVVELLNHCYKESPSGLGALIRILATPSTNMDASHIRPSFELALEGMLWRTDGKDVEERLRDINVLRNIKTLVVLEHKRNSPCLERMDVGRTISFCVEKVVY